MTTDKNPLPNSSSARSAFRNPWLLAPAIFLLLVIALLIAVPHAISYGAKQWILENGGDQVQVGDVDFNSFTATLALKDMQVQVDKETTLGIGRADARLAWLPLFNRRAHVLGISLSQCSIDIERSDLEALRIGGVYLPNVADDADENAAEGPWEFGIDRVSLMDCEIRYIDPLLSSIIKVNNLTLGELANWAPEKAATLKFDGTLDGAPVEFDGVIAPFAAAPDIKGKLGLSSLKLETYLELAQPALTSLAGELSADSQLNIRLNKDNVITVGQEGSVSVNALKVATTAETISNDTADWNGKVAVAVSPDSGAVTMNSNGRLSLEDLVTVFPAYHGLTIRNGALAWAGTVEVDTSKTPLAFSATGNFETHKLHASSEKDHINLIRLDTLLVDTIALEALDQGSIGKVDFENLVLAEQATEDGSTTPAGSMSSMSKMEFEGIQFGVTGLNMDKIIQTNVHALVRRDASGEWNMVKVMDVLENLATPDEDENTETPESKTTQVKQDETEVELRIGEFLVQGDNVITFEDRNVKPPFITTLNITYWNVKGIDSTQPDKPSPLEIKGRIGKHTPVNVKGTMKPFALPVAYDLKGNIEALELPPLSSYTVSQMGFEIDSGQLDADFDIKAEKGKLNGETDLTIHSLDIGSVNNRKLAEMESNLSVSLDVALSMLQDDNGVIHLEVPFSGTPDSPDFDVSDAINQALTAAVKQGSLTYLTMALQPYGTLITVAKYAGEQATKVRLNPIEFEPGSTELDSHDFDYLAKVAGILKERPKLNIKICGAAVQADRSPLARQAAAAASTAKSAKGAPEPVQVSDAQLTTLAEQRDDAVKDHLIAKHGVSAKRLVACEPNLDLKETDAKPRTDLLI